MSAKELSGTIKPGVQTTLPQKAKTLIFLRHHLAKNLKTEYLTERDSAVLWQSLKDRFDRQQDVVLPQAQYDWLNLQF